MKIAPYQIDSYIESIAKHTNLWGAVIYGPDSGLVSIRAGKISKAIVSDLTDPFLVTHISEKKFNDDKSWLIDEFFSMPMLGGRKLIVMTNIGNEATEPLKQIFGIDKKSPEFKKPLGENFILITIDELDKNSSLRKFAENNPYFACIACYEDDTATISQIIRQKFKEHGMAAEDGAVEYIVNKFGKNRLIILNELEKLFLFMGEEKFITIDLVQKNIADISEISASELINNFADLDPKNSNYFLNKLYDEKISPIALIRMISSYFLKLKIAKTNIENGANLETEIKSQRLFFKQEIFFKKHLSKWPLPALNNILLKLQELEVSCKSTGPAPELLLASFINLSCVKYGFAPPLTKNNKLFY